MKGKVMKLVSRVDVKLHLEVTVTDFDDLIDLLIEQISDRIEESLNRKLLKQEYTEYFDVFVSKKFFNLRAYPIDLTASFTASQYDVEDTINSDYYVFEDLGIVEYFSERNHCNQPKCMKFVYTGGYEEQYINNEYVLDVPASLARACLIQTAFEFRRRRDIGLTSITTPDGSVSKVVTGDLLTEVKNIIKTYKNYGYTRL